MAHFSRNCSNFYDSLDSWSRRLYCSEAPGTKLQTQFTEAPLRLSVNNFIGCTGLDIGHVAVAHSLIGGRCLDFMCIKEFIGIISNFSSPRVVLEHLEQKTYVSFIGLSNSELVGKTVDGI